MDSDWMDAIVDAAERQEFNVWQTEDGTWMFEKAGVTTSAGETPQTPLGWLGLVSALRSVGLTFPEQAQE